LGDAFDGRPGTSESRPGDSAGVLTLTRIAFTQTVLVATDFLKPLRQQLAAGCKPAMRQVSNPSRWERRFHERQRQAADLLNGS
jgi:hypothetical protein